MADFQAGALLDSLTRSDQRVCALLGKAAVSVQRCVPGD